jgi:hypothetical protein
MRFSLKKLFPDTPIDEPSLALSDCRWKELEGGYRGIKYDASIPLKGLEQVNSLKEAETIYEELWGELHHQGDVGIASYYAVVHLVRIAQEKRLIDYNVLALVSVIEIQRHKDNPELPKALEPVYFEALIVLKRLANTALEQDTDLSLVQSALAAIAVAQKQVKLAEAILKFDSEEEIDEFLDNY